MKVFILLSAILACAYAEGLEGGYGYAAPAIVSKVVNVNTGTSSQTRKQDASGNYAFSYVEQHSDATPWSSGGSGGSSREEKGDAWGNKEGSYSLNVGDGRQRLVKYVADGAGFRASIKTNEPGIVASQPAAVDINTPHDGWGPALAHAPAVVATNVGGLSYGASNLAGYGASLGGYDAGLAGYGSGLAGYGASNLAGYGAGLGGYDAGLAGAYKK